MSSNDDLRDQVMGKLLAKNVSEPVVESSNPKANTNTSELASAIKGSGSLLEQVMQNKAKQDAPDTELNEKRQTAVDSLQDNLSLLGKLI